MSNPTAQDTSIRAQLASAPIFPLLLRLALPVTAAQLVNALYSLVDRIFIGHIPQVGTDALTGLGFTLPIIMIVAAFSLLVGMGGSPLVSIRIGEGDFAGAARLQGTSFTLLLVMGVLLPAIVFPLRRPLLLLFGASEATLTYAADYLGLYVLGSIFVMLSTGMNVFLNAQGCTLAGTVTVVVGAVLNLLLDPLFIFGFGMGIAGAAIATVLAQLVSAAWAVWYLFCSPQLTVRLKLSDLGICLADTVAICRLGVSTFIFNVNESAVQILLNLLLRHWGGYGATGDLYIGSMTIINSLMSIFFMPLQGIVRGAQPIIGYCCGARNYPRLRATVRYARICSITTAVFMWAVLMLFPVPLAGLFSQDEALLSLTAPLIRLSFCTIFVLGLQMVNQHAFIAMANAKLSFFFGILRKILLLIPLAILLPYRLGIVGIFLAEPIGNVITVIITQIVFTRYLAQTRRQFEADTAAAAQTPAAT